MRHLIALALLASPLVLASDTPVSGTFSNVQSNATEGLKPTLTNKINLVVTVNSNGQQFFLQCFTQNEAGFGETTVLEKPQIKAEIKAGKECPSETAEIQLDYADAIVRFKSGWVYLPRGDIYVPVNE